MKSGLVLSDLHLFSPRSEGFERMAALWDEVTRAEMLVLNGDIFDFRWTCLPDEAATLTAALDWLHKLFDDFEGSAIHYVLGIDHCYFGHTHCPFSDHSHQGVRFHNTGSGIRGMGFLPMGFEV